MAEQTTTPTPIGKPISAFEELTEIQGTEIIPVVDGKNKKVSAETLKTFAQKGVVKEVNGKGLSTNDYTNDAKQKLDSLPTNEKLNETLGDVIKARALESLKSRAKAAGVVYNEATGFFEHNTLTDITATEVENMLLCIQRPPYNVMGGPECYSLRTNIFRGTGQNSSDNHITVAGLFEAWSNAEVLSLNNGGETSFTTRLDGGSIFNGCVSLHTILGVFRLETATAAKSPFAKCVALREFKLREMKFSMSIEYSPLLSLDTLQYLVENAVNTSAITVTVHPDVYAKLSDETNTEWHKVMTDGAAKNISFATTE